MPSVHAAFEARKARVPHAKPQCEELHAPVLAMRAATEWPGAADLEVCGRCRYRSICPVSASPGEPVWPRFDDEDDDDV